MEEVNYSDEFVWDSNDNDKYKSPKREPGAFQRKPYEPKKDVIKTIYTDGGSKLVDVDEKGVKHYVGAWAFYDEDCEELCGEALDWSTNQMSELTAAIKALEYCNELGVSKDNGVVKINLDSEYVRKGVVFWMNNWAKNNWVRIIRDPSGNETTAEIKNVDLWKKLYDLVQDRGRYNIWWNHVDGHSGIEGNERVDIKCSSCIENYMQDNGYESYKRGGRK